MVTENSRMKTMFLLYHQCYQEGKSMVRDSGLLNVFGELEYNRTGFEDFVAFGDTYCEHLVLDMLLLELL